LNYNILSIWYTWCCLLLYFFNTLL